MTDNTMQEQTPDDAEGRKIDWYTPEEIREKIASNDYSAELMLRHAMHWIDDRATKKTISPHDQAILDVQVRLWQRKVRLLQEEIERLNDLVRFATGAQDGEKENG